MDLKKARVLGTRLDLADREKALSLIWSWLKDRPGGLPAKHVVTAYSEFYVAALRDQDFRMALEDADLVVPDGIGPLAAVNYRQAATSKDGTLFRFVKGIEIGLDILRGGVGETVPGMWLFEELIKIADNKKSKVFLLGGYGQTARTLAKELKTARTQELKITYDAGAQGPEQMVGEVNDKVIAKINKFKPDILFVAYGPVKQEKWIAANKGKLKAGVVIGVGGTFDELTGKVRKAPEWTYRLGLKWLWRLIQEPKRVKRIWNAVVIFPWLVFRSIR